MKAWHVVETPDKIIIYLRSEEGDESIEVSKSDKDFMKKMKEYAKKHELVRKHFILHHKKDIIEKEG
jgi:hypothetical protein